MDLDVEAEALAHGRDRHAVDVVDRLGVGQLGEGGPGELGPGVVALRREVVELVLAHVDAEVGRLDGAVVHDGVEVPLGDGVDGGGRCERAWVWGRSGSPARRYPSACTCHPIPPNAPDRRYAVRHPRAHLTQFLRRTRRVCRPRTPPDHLTQSSRAVGTSAGRWRAPSPGSRAVAGRPPPHAPPRRGRHRGAPRG